MEAMEKKPAKTLVSFEQTRLNLMIDATNKCNLRCTYCYYGNKGKNYMNVGNIIKAVENFIPLFPNLKEVNFHYMGGEPLIAWDQILELNALAKKLIIPKGYTYSWSLTSNLTLLDDKKTDHMLAEKASIHCSIDGPEFIHNKNRPYLNGHGSFQRVIKNAKKALMINPDDTVKVTVCPEDALLLADIAEFLFSVGYKTVGLFPAFNMNWQDKDIANWGTGIAKANQLLKSEQKKSLSLHTFVRPKMRSTKIFTYCGAGKGLWAFDVWGKIYFCHHFTNNPELAITNAVISSPQKIKESIINSTIPPTVESIPVTCEKCPIQQFCNGNCWAENFFSTGHSNMQQEIVCKMKKITIDALDYIFQTDCKPLPQDIKAMSDCRNCYECENCYSGCDRCDDCHKCNICDSCQKCVSCQSNCETNCQSSCEDSCQLRCEKYCQYCEECDGACKDGCWNCDVCTVGYP